MRVVPKMQAYWHTASSARQRIHPTQLALSCSCYNFPVNEVRPMTADERYRLPTLSSLLPAYTNSEGDYIAGAFSTGAMQLIHDMPAELRPRSVIEQRQAKQQAALELTPGTLQSACTALRCSGDGLWKHEPKCDVLEALAVTVSQSFAAALVLRSLLDGKATLF